MEKRLKDIIKEEITDFFKGLENHLDDSQERLGDKIEYLKKSYNALPSDRPEEKKARDSERKDSEEELKDVDKMEKELEDKKDSVEKKEKENKSNILNNPVSTTASITGSIS